MSRRPSPLIAFICVLFLLGAQQAACAHWIGHVGAAVGMASAPASGNNRDAGDATFHVCTTCAAFATLDAAPPAFVPPIVVTLAVAISVPDIPTAHVPARTASPYTARAPPVVL